MPLNIKDADTHALAKRLASLTGESLTEAVKHGSSGKWGGAASQRQAAETAALCKPWKNK